MSIEDPFPQSRLKCLNKPRDVMIKKQKTGRRLRKLICILNMHKGEDKERYIGELVQYIAP